MSSTPSVSLPWGASAARQLARGARTGMLMALAAVWPLDLVAAASPAQAAGQAAVAGTGRTADADPGWPREYTTPDGHLVRVYAPQIASWDDRARLVAYLAVGHLARGTERPVLGTIRVEADTTVAIEARLVRLSNLAITDVRFGGLDRERTKAVVADVKRVLHDGERLISLDRVLAGLDTSAFRPKNVADVKADPPRIFFSIRPAILVGFDGEPIWSPLEGSDLRFAVNTNWDVFEHTPSRTLFLRHELAWLKAPGMAGPWTPAGTLPPSFARLPSDANWAAVKASLPGRRLAPGDAPVVFVSTGPAELLLLRGEASYVSVSAESPLLWVHNTDSDLFRMGRSGSVYYLVAGRWFSAPGFEGPWTFATPTLPPVFARIGPDHPRSRVLASVPGTPQAAEAVVLAQIPETARVSRASVRAPEVRYVGQPRFEPIQRTSLQRAVNTDKDVVKAGDMYYLCYQGVWFVSTSPHGPWQLAGSVPPAIYAIPASSPSHHVTYVTIVEERPDTVVFATTPGYSGVTIAWGCAVWGTGWYYAPYVAYGGAYPVYYPYYPTYGYSAWYNPWTGGYQRGAAAYGPYGGVGAGARYDPATGTYARGAVTWGPYGASGAAQAYNPRTGTYAQTRQGAGAYGSWGAGSVQRGSDWARTARATNDVTGVTSRVTQTDDGAMVSRRGPGGSGFVAAGEEGIYAGRDGNVYRHAEGGGWQKYEDGSWGAAQNPRESGTPSRDRPDPNAADRSTIGQLERDRSARLEGAQRTRDFGALRSGEQARPSGARRASGGRARRR